MTNNGLIKLFIIILNFLLYIHLIYIDIFIWKFFWINDIFFNNSVCFIHIIQYRTNIVFVYLHLTKLFINFLEILIIQFKLFFYLKFLSLYRILRIPIQLTKIWDPRHTKLSYILQFFLKIWNLIFIFWFLLILLYQLL